MDTNHRILQTNQNQNNNYNSNNNNKNFINNDLIDYEVANSIDYSNTDDLSTDRDSVTRSKYDTVPNIRNSAKNRRKLEKIFSLNSSQTRSSTTTNNQARQIDKDENNLYLSKLRAEKNYQESSSSNQATSSNNTSRYSPSNPESGFFSISDQEYAENRFIKQQQQQQQFSDSNGRKSNNTNNRKSISIEELIAPVANLNTQTSAPNDEIIISSPNSFLIHLKSLSSNSKLSNHLDVTSNNNNTIKQQSSNNLEYNPLVGVSFKQTHASDVEIVGVKLGNNQQNNFVEPAALSNNLNTKKKNSLKSKK